MTIEELTQKTLEEIRKSNKEVYPLYYKEVFNTLAKDYKVTDISKKLLLDEPLIGEAFLEQTHETTKFIQSTNDNIKANSENFIQEIEVKDLGEDIKNLVKGFEHALVDKLSESNKHISELQNELNKVYNELNIDSLTKAYSRKAFQKDIDKLIKIGAEKELDTILVIFDLDHFKTINDTYGHLVGDFVLIKVVKFISEIIRDGDKIYRFGGDEFIIIFNRLDKKAIKDITEKIRLKIEKTKLKYKGQIIKLTISMGAACHIKGDTEKSWIHRADKALYEAKITRNKVSILC